MADFRAARRYALALLGVADERKSLDEVSKDLELLRKIFGNSREFINFIKSPVVNSEKKRCVMEELLNGKVGDVTMKFALLLNRKGREGLLPEIVEEFFRLRDEKLGMMAVKIRTAVKFSPDQEAKLLRHLETSTKKKVRASYVVDSTLKGGFLVEMNDTVWDASVRHQLELLKQRFIEEAA